MKKRVNNDLKQTLTILRDGQPEIFTDATNISLKAYIPNLYSTDIPFTRVNNVFSVAAPANTLKIGVYTYVLTYNKPDTDFESGLATYTIDFKDAFEIVRHTEDEDAEGQNLTGNVGDAVLPSGGNLGDMLVKKSDASNDFEWLPVLKTTGTNDIRPVSQKLVTDQLALKVDKSSIANNLTTTDEGKVLDARQGKALDEAKINKDGSNSDIDILHFNPETLDELANVGDVRYSSESKTLEVKITESCTIQIGQEMTCRVKNGETSNILNGKVVYIDTAVGANPVAKLATTADQDIAQRTFAVATEDIDTFGVVTTEGLVRGVNTNGIDEGSLIWLGVDGNFTATEPTAPTPKVCIGMVLRESATVGVIYVHIRAIPRMAKLSDVFTTTLTGGDILRYNSTSGRFEQFNITTALSGKKNYHGIETYTAFTFDNSTKVLTLPAVKYWYKGTAFTSTGAITCDLDLTADRDNSTNTLTTNTLYYIYFKDATGKLYWSDTMFDFNNDVILCTIYWNGSAGAVQVEAHGYDRDIAWHKWAHLTIGTRYLSGLTLTAPTTANDGTIDIATGVIRDEDISFTTGRQQVMRGWRLASATKYTWADYSIPYLGTLGAPAFNNASYALETFAANRYACYWVYASLDKDRPIYIIPSQISAAYTTIANARAEAPPTLANLPFNAEFKLIYRFIYSGNGEFQESADYRLSQPLPSGGIGTVTAGAVSFSPAGGISATSVQAALEELDTEKENISNKVTSLSSASTDTQYPSAKTAYNAIQPKTFAGEELRIISPYIEKTNVYKGQIHNHTTGSDGADTPTALVTAYRDAGYDFVAITDHDIYTADPAVSGILFIGGVEHSTTTGHISALGVTERVSTSTDPQTIIDAIIAANGIPILNHPSNTYAGFTDNEIEKYAGYYGMEIYNKLSSPYLFESKVWAALSKGIRFNLIASDDCHDISTGLGFGWINVFSDDLTLPNILKSIKEGNYYSTQGAEMNIVVNGNLITVTSPVACDIDFIGKSGTVLQTEIGTTSSYTVLGNEGWVVVRIAKRSDAKKAWSNPIIIQSQKPKKILTCTGNIHLGGRLERGVGDGVSIVYLETTDGCIRIAPTGWRTAGRAAILVDTKTDLPAEFDLRHDESGTKYGWQFSARGSGNTRDMQIYSNANGTYTLRETWKHATGWRGIGVAAPKSMLHIGGAVQVGNDTDSASADKVGALRYRTSGNNSYVEMCVQTGATTYAWEVILTKTW